MMRLTALASSISGAAAWWCDGHMLVANAALKSDIMSSSTVEKATAVIEEINNYYPTSPDFVTAACWADDLKSDGAAQEAVSTAICRTPSSITAGFGLLCDGVQRVVNLPRVRCDRVANPCFIQLGSLSDCFGGTAAPITLYSAILELVRRCNSLVAEQCQHAGGCG